ncbi:MAG TPA: hypothetical protein VKX17_10880 [Planctomycetota bacterium]|nr:hypothetical protein [Planctomycetota bacterium]
MPAKSRQLVLRKAVRPGLIEAGRMANENPDKLARNLLRSSPFSKNRNRKLEIWSLLQNLGSDAVVKRATAQTARARSTAELVAVLNAAEADGWYETGPAIARRLALEATQLGKRTPSSDALQRLEALASAGARLSVQFESADLRKLLKHASARLRGIGAVYAQKMKRADVVRELMSIAWSRGPGAAAALEAIRELGDAECAAAIWGRALLARRRAGGPPAPRGGGALLHGYLKTLGALGAFDCQIALRVWIEEDFAKSEDAGWEHAEAWCSFALAKMAAGECDRAAALEDLRWFQHIAERSAIPAARMDGEGVFHLARAFFAIGAKDDAEHLVRRAAVRSLPNPEKFAELLPMALGIARGGTLVLRQASPQSHPSPVTSLPQGERGKTAAFGGGTGLAPTAWLAAAGDLAAQRKITENWPVLLRDGRRPLNWDLRNKLDASILRETLLAALNCETPGAARRVLKFLSGDPTATVIRDEIERLAESHASEVVRWKARRVVLEGRHSWRPETVGTPRDGATIFGGRSAAAPKWVRLDAAALSGALKTGEPKRRAHAAESAPAGILPPERDGRGWRLAFEGLRGAARRETEKAILKAPLSRALHRRAPLGPSYEERPDVRAVRELASPHNSVDEQMAEMARAVMDFWVYGDEFLTLDLNGIAQVSAFLSAANVSMDSEDIAACGAFIGEALRKRIGGEWSGFDGHYRLEIKGENFDPIGLARQLFERKDPFHGPMLASEMFVTAEARLNPPKKSALPRDTGASFERAIKSLCELPPGSPMSELMAETRVFSYRMEPTDWPAVLAACDPLLENSSGARIAAAIAIYAPGEALARTWARWGSRRREISGVAKFLAEAMRAASERDDMEAMPDWTIQVPASRFSFLNSLRKRMTAADWRKALMLLLRQRASAGDLAGTGWCLFSYKYEYPDSLPLLQAFCEMTVSSRQTLLRATRHCTRDEVKLFRPLWAEGLRDPSPAVVLAALDCTAYNRAKSLRPLAEKLKHDERPDIAVAATTVVDGLDAQ